MLTHCGLNSILLNLRLQMHFFPLLLNSWQIWNMSSLGVVLLRRSEGLPTSAAGSAPVFLFLLSLKRSCSY